MALLDFLKSRPDETAVSSVPAVTGVKGPVGDSDDSEVFLSFPSVSRTIWYCAECGTRNEQTLNGCIVCGLKK